MKFFSYVACAAFCLSSAVAVAQTTDDLNEKRILPGVYTSLTYSEDMFDRQNLVTNKIARALRARRDGEIKLNTLTFGGRFIGTVIHEQTNTAGKFPILSRLPPSHTSGTSDSFFSVTDLSFGATLALPMVTAYLQGEYTEIAYPGQSQTQWRKAWIAIGDLDRSPFYAAFGRNTLNFGNFATYAPFTHSHSAHYFWAQTDEPHFELGYLTDRTEISASILTNHRGLRVVSSPSNDGALGNYAINASHRFSVSEQMDLTLGAGYLRGTIYDSVIAHHPPDVGVDRTWNGAWTVNGTLSGKNFDLMAEFTQTDHLWPATGSNRPAAYSCGM